MGHSELDKLVIEIRGDVEHGASELAVKAVYALIEAARLLRNECRDTDNADINEYARKLKSARPSMAPLRNAVDRIIKSSLEGVNDTQQVHDRIIENGRKLIDNMRSAAKQIAVFAKKVILPGDTILLYSYSSTVVKALNSFDSEYQLKIIVPRSGTAVSGFTVIKELNKEKFNITYIDDTALSLFAEESDKLITGADRVCSDGTLINAAGTSLAAMAAKSEEIPVYVLCDSLKCDPSVIGHDAELEEKEISGMRIPPELTGQIEIRNPYFDRTSADLITAYITEEGIIDRKDISDYIRKLTG